MTDPYRYLPCGLHEALTVPSWATVSDVVPNDDEPPDVPFVLHYVGPKGPDEDLDEDDIISGRCGDTVDLAHPAGWDHAVRALAAVRGVEAPESASVSFHLRTEQWALTVGGSFTLYFDDDHIPPRTEPGWMIPFSAMFMSSREALCRCICTALGLDVGAVFPVERS